MWFQVSVPIVLLVDRLLSFGCESLVKGPIKLLYLSMGIESGLSVTLKTIKVGKFKSLRMDVTRAWKDSDCRCWRFTWLRAAWRGKCGEAYVRA